jgi:crotonobetainyl-CoA:carnitine CoA-transferase CaiB-like acyl-CoA transferase
VINPLSDLTVIDLSQTVRGAYCTKLLAGLGARVIKIEPPSGDVLRRMYPFHEDKIGQETSIPFGHLNTCKESVTLSIESRTGRILLERLIAQSDILVETFVPGWLSQIGIHDDFLQAANPNLIVVSVSYFGQTGPYASLHGSEIVASALGGWVFLTGDPKKPPLKAYGYQAEFQAGLQAAVGALVALSAHDTGAKGQSVDASVMEAASFVLGGVPQVCHVEGEIPRRNGNRLVGFGPTMGYPSTYRPCRDGWVHVHTSYRNQELIAVLLEDERLSRPELISHPFAHADEIDEYVDSWLATRERREAVTAAQELRLPFTGVLTPEEVVADETGHLAQRRAFQAVQRSPAGLVEQPAPPVRFSPDGPQSAAPKQMRSAPALGEHNNSVLCGMLGVTAQQLPKLRAAGVI